MERPSEHKADLAIQAFGLAASIVSSGMLIGWVMAYGGTTARVAALVYGLTLPLMFVCSLLNAVATPERKARWRMLDHIAIYLLIAGTYTPVCLMVIGGSRGAVLLAGVWAIAALGTVLEIVLRDRFRQCAIALYLLAGWSGLVEMDQVIAGLPTSASVLLVMGGVVYTVGVPAHCCDWLPYSRAIWHTAVLVASACLYGVVTVAVAGTPLS